MCALVIGVHSCALPISAGDCLYFASPPAFHLNYARDAFAQGRAVFCEKPLAVDVAEAEAFVAEAEKTGARAAVNFPFASMAGVAQLLRWMVDVDHPVARLMTHRRQLVHLRAVIMVVIGEIGRATCRERVGPDV